MAALDFISSLLSFFIFANFAFLMLRSLPASLIGDSSTNGAFAALAETGAAAGSAGAAAFAAAGSAGAASFAAAGS